MINFSGLNSDLSNSKPCNKIENLAKSTHVRFGQMLTQIGQTLYLRPMLHKKAMKYTIRFAIFIYIVQTMALQLTGQNQTIDSLKAMVEKSFDDKERVDQLQVLAHKIAEESYPESIIFLLQANALAQKIQYQEGIQLSSKLLSKHYSHLNKMDSALHFAKLFHKETSFQKDSAVIAESNTILGDIYNEMGENDLAFDHLITAAEIAERNGFLREASKSYSSISNLIMGTHDTEKAIEYQKKALSLSEKLGTDQELIAYNCNILANFYDDGDQQLIYLKRAIAISEKEGFKALLANCYTSMGNYYYYHTDSLEPAKRFFLKSIEVGEELGLEKRLGISHYFLAPVYMDLNKPDSALISYRKAHHSFSEKKESYGYFNNLMNMSKALSKLNRHHEAYDSLMVSYDLASKYYSSNLKQKLIESNTQYETAKKEQQIVAQELEIEKQRSSRNKILFGGIFLLSIASGIYMWYYQRGQHLKQKIEASLKLAEEKAEDLRKLDVFKDQLFTNISHELRTPLTLISEPLRKVLQSPPDKREDEDINLAYKNSQKLLSLINEIMDLSKLEAGKLSVQDSNIQINSYLQRILMAFESFANIKGVDLTFESHVSDEITIISDKDHLEKILNNLISNAIKFSNEGGIVGLKVAAENDTLQLAISDTGSGIAEKDKALIFNRFYQTEQGNNYSGGTGVGLALSRELAHLLGGTLQVASELNSGSTFTLSIPLRLSSQKEEAMKIMVDEELSSESYIPLTINGEKPRILVVEDNTDMSGFINKLLSTNYQISMASNGIEGLQTIQKENFDLVISDVMMPNMDGFQLREKIISMKGYKATPYVFLTARSMDEDIMRGLRLGVDDYITKPFRSEELLARVNNLIRNKIERDIWIADHIEEQRIPDESEDIRFIKQAEKLVFTNMSRIDYKITDFSKEMAYSQRQLTRKLKTLTGFSPVEFILELRLQKARQLLEQGIHNSLSDIRYEIGIESASYFSRKFKERFGVNPSQYFS